MTSPAPRLKRRRVPLACSSCRQRKSRCTGESPCSMCKDLQVECIYPDESSNNLTGDKRYILRLEKRLVGIERTVQQLWQAKGPITSSPVAAQPTDDVAQKRQSDTISELGEVDYSENAIDGMGAMNFTDEKECGFFGPSSNIAFMRYLSRAMSKTESNDVSRVVTPPPVRKRGGMESVGQTQAPGVSQEPTAVDFIAPRHVNIYALPPEDRTRTLIEQYFEKTGQLLPFIHEISFRETYLQMRLRGFSKIRRTWLGLLNIILAISTSLSMKDGISPEERIQESDIYYQRANSLCDRESKRNASLEMVQYLLILGQYLQGTQKSIQAWTTHGLAISAAYQIGLHSPDTNQGYSPLECEIRKRTWFGCVLLDRTLSMTFGRPCSIPESYIQLDLPSQEIQMLSSGSEDGGSSQLDGAFFTAAIKLYVILYHVLDSCYGQNLGLQNSLSAADSMSHILDGQRRLNEWRTQLVPSLGLHIHEHLMTPEEVKEIDPRYTIKQRFDIVLSVRYHNLRILLHRSRLESLLKAFWLPSDISAEDKRIVMPMGLASVHSCVESASSIIAMVNSITTSTARHHELLGGWNYTLYYTFNAALVIVGCMIVAWKDRDDSPSTWDTVDKSRGYIEKAIGALRRLDSGNRVIARCIEYLSQVVLILDTLSKSSVPLGIGGDSSMQLRQRKLILKSWVRLICHFKFHLTDKICVQLQIDRIRTIQRLPVCFQNSGVTFSLLNTLTHYLT
ncbi:fungal-specific transcription factor domain-containing protein [Lipomyces orientalis]|uniref:Fungal-specific transcription factor domain-containing protein n=1 Tax=Lipomyces orientalis TaxID=1233043 RepID=A0ACC3TF78_9ASCO